MFRLSLLQVDEYEDEEYSGGPIVHYNGEWLSYWRRFSRYIYDIEGMLLKVECDADVEDYSQCQREVDLWYSIIDKSDRKYFVEPLAWGDNWVLQEKVELRNYASNWSRKRTFFNIINPLCDKYGIEDIRQYSRNWGLVRYRPKIYDYGWIVGL